MVHAAGLFDGAQKAFLVDGLLQKIDRALEHGVDRRVDVAVGGEKDHGQDVFLDLQLMLQIRPRRARHLEVEHETARHLRVVLFEKGEGAVVGNALPALHLQKEGEGAPQGRIVVDDPNEGRLLQDFLRERHGGPQRTVTTSFKAKRDFGREALRSSLAR